MTDPLFYLIVILCLAVVGVLAFGIGGFAKGGEFNKRNGNRMMRWRLGLQAAAVAVIVLFVWLRARAGG
jgi:uncharacterized membrane protein affecting hemolysin expression